MLITTRRQTILAELRSVGEVSVTELATQFGVSPSTIRRDLNALSKDGRIHRVRGGSSLDDGDRPFVEVAGNQADKKSLIGARAAQLVRDRDVVLLDIGTTVAQVALHLRGRKITVVTASLAVVDVLRGDPDTELVVLGGVLRNSYLSLVGSLTSQALSQITADICFLGASGVRADGCPMDSTSIEVPIKSAILRSSGRSVLVADESKFPGSGVQPYCQPGQIDVLVTNKGHDSAGLAALREHHTEVIFV